MSSVVLGLLTRPESLPAVLAGADRLGRLLGGATLETLVVRTAPESTILVTEEVLPKSVEDRLRAEEAGRVRVLNHIVDAWLAREGAGAALHRHDEEGFPEALVKRWGERADYIVAGRPPPHASPGETSLLHAAIFATDRPVLIMPAAPQTAAFGRVIAIAWRDDHFTLRAVLAALRCASESPVIHVLMGRRPGAPQVSPPSVLAEHGIVAIPHELPIGKGVFGAEILEAAHAIGADLLVMGAFVHSAWHSMMFGGVTRHVLAHGDLPVLMRH
jgi:nucleotide-binding universal stress UspA family protein